jgi:hypothetical protein
VAVIVAAAVGVGLALTLNKNNTNENAANAGNTSTAGGTGTPTPSVADTPSGLNSVDALNNPSAVLPSGYVTYTVTAAEGGSPAVAGFNIDVPNSWTEQRSGLVTTFLGPDNMKFEIDMSPQDTPDMVTAAQNVEQQAVAKGTYPGYQQVTLKQVPVRHTYGAAWKFHWIPNGVQYTADDIFYHAPTSAGAQDYAFYFRSPSSNFNKTLSTIEKILPTFQIVTS